MENENIKMSRDEKKEILKGIQDQIASFDNKASIFLAAFGIVFALTSTILDNFHSEWFIQMDSYAYTVWFKVLFVLIIVISIFVFLSFALVLFPRKKNISNIYGNYYSDIANSRRDDINEMLNNYATNDELLIDQIKINSDICKRKHCFLEIGMMFLILFVLL